MAIQRVRSDDLDALAAIALVLVVVSAIALYLILRSHDLAGRVGPALGGAVRWVSGLLRREVKTDFRYLVLEFRDQASEVLRKRALLRLTAGVLARTASFAILILAIRYVGIGADQVTGRSSSRPSR